jgi:hypothetical protein
LDKLADRIARATAALQRAPDVSAREATRAQVESILRAQMDAWVILTEDQND